MLRQLLNVAYADLASRTEDQAQLDAELEGEPTGGRRRPPGPSRGVRALMAAASLPQPPRLSVVEGGDGP